MRRFSHHTVPMHQVYCLAPPAGTLRCRARPALSHRELSPKFVKLLKFVEKPQKIL